MSAAQASSMRCRDRVALITAAGSGLGRAAAEIIGREGGAVVAVDLDEGQLKDLVGSVCFLASSDADFVTGVTIDVTGGQ